MSAPRSSFGPLPLNKHFKSFDVQNGGVIFFFRDLEAFFEAGQTTNLRNISLPLDEYVGKPRLFHLMDGNNRPFPNQAV